MYRELQRKSGKRGYRPKQAQRLADKRRQACRRAHKLDDREVYQYVRERMEMRWSPDQIAQRSRLDFPRQPSRWLSDQTGNRGCVAVVDHRKNEESWSIAFVSIAALT